MARHTSLRWNVAPRSGLETLIQQTSPVASDRLWVVASHLHHYITVSNGKLRGERVPSRPDRPTPGRLHHRPEGRRTSGPYCYPEPRPVRPEIPVSHAARPSGRVSFADLRARPAGGG